jgi:hypothetical protein
MDAVQSMRKKAKDLGPNTLEIARNIERFNPDKTWSPVDEK